MDMSGVRSSASSPDSFSVSHSEPARWSTERGVSPSEPVLTDAIGAATMSPATTWRRSAPPPPLDPSSPLAAPHPPLAT